MLGVHNLSIQILLAVYNVYRRICMHIMYIIHPLCSFFKIFVLYFLRYLYCFFAPLLLFTQQLSCTQTYVVYFHGVSHGVF